MALFGTVYTFERNTAIASDTTIQNGHGSPNARTGMSKCMFRPSDDAVILPFLIPANAMTVVELRKTADMIDSLVVPNNYDQLSEQMRSLADEIDSAIAQYGTTFNQITGEKTFVYEADGFGNTVFMDDANIPGLLSLPYLEYIDRSDPVYLATRRAVLSRATNPYFFSGFAGEGVGGPH